MLRLQPAGCNCSEKLTGAAVTRIESLLILRMEGPQGEQGGARGGFRLGKFTEAATPQVQFSLGTWMRA
jgi:hypothetical protein